MGFGSGGSGFGNLRDARKCESFKQCNSSEKQHPVHVSVYHKNRLVRLNASKSCHQFCTRAVQDMVIAVMNEYPYQHIRYDPENVRITATDNYNGQWTQLHERGVEDYLNKTLRRNGTVHLRIHTRTKMNEHSSSIFREWWDTDGDENPISGGSEVNFIIEMGYMDQWTN